MSNNDGSGIVLGVLLAVVIVGFGAWAMGVTPWHRQTNIVVETPAQVAPAQPSSGDANTTN